MKFWATSEAMQGVSKLFFSTLERKGAINGLIDSLNLNLLDIDTGDFGKWRVIFIIVPDYLKDAFRETRRLTRKDMTLDFRVHVDFERALTATFQECIELLTAALEKTLPYFKKAKISADVQNQILQCLHVAAVEAIAKHESRAAI